jgi:CheY-like chemotaxis protein
MPTILLVDDRRDAHVTVGSKLEGMGFTVRSLNTAIDIIERVVEELPDVIFLDMNMPEVDGCEAAQLLQADERTTNIPIVMLSSHASLSDADIAKACGCITLLDKPLEPTSVKRVLNQIFSEKESTKIE